MATWKSPGIKDQDNTLGRVAPSYNPSLGKCTQDQERFLIKNCCMWLSKSLKSDVTGEEGLGQDSHYPSAHQQGFQVHAKAEATPPRKIGMQWCQAPWLVRTQSYNGTPTRKSFLLEPEQQGHPRALDGERALQLKRSQTYFPGNRPLSIICHVNT